MIKKTVINSWNGRPTETLEVPDGTVWSWKIFGYAPSETADLWLETSLTGVELLRLLEPGTDNEEFLGTLDNASGRRIRLRVETQEHTRTVHELARKNPGGINSLRWHLKALAVELGEEIETLRADERDSRLGLPGKQRLAALENVLEQIALWPEDE